ncbi:speckle-type POZ protein B-like [Nasonia vitripennis]|uniref:BTB domain-containing protein n=1 Tax=Nasonia vitripennis TaxID=7425 RepID=A0A7M7H3K6_NASVI|nr:speckle-type POZ protein B-like [Nasonia vitripennis]
MGKIQPVRHFSSIKVSPITYKKNQLSREVSLRLEEFDDFESILNDRNFSDVSISIEGKTIMACKLILMKKSPVFAAMFRADMKERNKNAVLIEDIKYDIFMELLRFIYSGKVRQLETIAVDLLAAVDKYRMENLKTMCELEPIKQMGIDDAVRMLKLADKYRAKKLKKRAIEYIVENKIDIFDQAEFRGLDKELMYNICQAIK